MKFTLAVVASALWSAVAATGTRFERLDKNDTVLLVVDMQEGLYSIARDFDATLYRDNMIAHAAVGKLFNLPVIMTTSAETGSNGRLPEEITAMYPNAPLIKRNGEVDAWDNSDFRAAVEATGKHQVILAGITTDVCTTFLALSLVEAGYSVWANLEASGTTTELIRDASNDRMMRAGVNVVSLFAIVMDLMRDWRNTPGLNEVLPWLDQYYPVYGYVARSHRAAIVNGTLSDAEASLPLKH